MAIFDSDSITLAPNIEGFDDSLHGVKDYLLAAEDHYSLEGLLLPTRELEYVNIDGLSDLFLDESVASLVKLSGPDISIAVSGGQHTLVTTPDTSALSFAGDGQIKLMLSELPDEHLTIDFSGGAIKIELLDEDARDGALSISGSELFINGLSTGISWVDSSGGVEVGEGIQFTSGGASLNVVGTPDFSTPVDASPAAEAVGAEALLFDDDIVIDEDQLAELSAANSQMAMDLGAVSAFVSANDVLVIDSTELEPVPVDANVKSAEPVDSAPIYEISEVIDASSLYAIGLEDDYSGLI